MSDAPTPTHHEHEINEPWRSHVAALRQAIQSARDEELRLRGMTMEAAERRAYADSKLHEILDLIRREAGLPEPCQLSADGTRLISPVTNTQ